MNPETQDTFNTILQPSEEVLFKEKGSKFFGYAFPITSETEVRPILEQLRSRHYAARHWCYAYQLGAEKVTFRANDDGEPNNSAGMPIYGQIQSFKVTDILVVVVRYFGGIKLGVGGLISAYKTTAQMALEQSDITEKVIRIHFELRFGYKNLNKVMRMIRENQLEIISQKMENDCEMEISCRKKTAENVFEQFQSAFEIDIQKKP
ncbi:YigZ family protein [Flavobacterium magnum]|uniref:YigZ family protein n=1 Tax=Flavobacterium magnum TaxID=2162713 RepID=A0A2S0RJD5_9FLAO|nr:YigZ family protein [Flavobacterium magnum]AWA31318.1 YigZ family protein [Flavobacterium magnum]